MISSNAKSKLNIDYKAAIVASSAFESDSYRNGFDISVPLFNPLTAHEPSSPLKLYFFFLLLKYSLKF